MNFKLISFFRLFSFYLLLILYVSNSHSFAQENQDSTRPKPILYWEKDAYRAYNLDTAFVTDNTAQDIYSSIKKKYNSNEFEYDESKVKKSSFLDRLRRWVNDFFDSISPDWDFDVYKVFYYLLLILGIVTLVFIFYKLLFSKNALFQTTKKENYDSEIQFVERNLLSIDIQPYIQEAIAKKEWNLAIRYLHLHNLQLLAKKEIIHWDYRKTNQEFSTEIKDKTLQQAFQKTTLLFNYIWFGDFELNQIDFEKFQKDFIHFKNLLA